MHHALKIEEILSNIFEYCYSSVYHRKPDLAALARTCRTFKDPALDKIWRDLVDLSPLARCLPEVSSRSGEEGMYSFTRAPTETEWDIIQSYTRRVRNILDIETGLSKKSLRALANRRPSAGVLFPSLRRLECAYTRKIMPLLRLPFPSLVFLDVEFENPRFLQPCLQSFLSHSPRIESLSIVAYGTATTATPISVEPNYFSHWRNLRSLVCIPPLLDGDALVQLSHMPALTQLDFTLSAALPVFDVPPSFSRLDHLTLHSESLRSVSDLLSRIQLIAVMDLVATTGNCPSRQEILSFLASIRTAGAGNTKMLRLAEISPVWNGVSHSEKPLLGLEDLRPCMAFSNLCSLSVDIEWDVGLTDGDILALVSAWPLLECLSINHQRGWNSRGGISPHGLVQLLQTRRSLDTLALALDTRGYTKPPSSKQFAGFGSTLPPSFSINVIDSLIKAESVPAITALFLGFKAVSDFSLEHWEHRRVSPNSPMAMKESVNRWSLISDQVNNGDSDSSGSDSD